MTMPRVSTKADTPTVAIVGLGPKGLYCLEALLNEFCTRPLSGGLHIALFNQSPYFGTSPVYDVEQPDYLLLISTAGELDVWSSSDSKVVVGGTARFISWYEDTFKIDTPLTGYEYLPRAVAGRYLTERFELLVSHLPSGIRLSCFVGQVVDIVPRRPGYVLKFIDVAGEKRDLCAEKVMLATGHSRVSMGAEEYTYMRFVARKTAASYTPYIYPVSAHMGDVPAGARVAMKGLGLTFIDTVLTLTEGRGGSFERTRDGSLFYRKSGHEPQTIVPFSRTGLPTAPIPHDIPSTLRPLTFVTPDSLTKLRSYSPCGKLDFDKDVWPLFQHEMELQYYRVVMGTGKERTKLETCGDDSEAMRHVIDSFLDAHPMQERFNYKQVLDPVGEQHFSTGAEFGSFIERYMQKEIFDARLGLVGSAVKAAITIWYEVRAALRPFIAFGGLTPKSHRKLKEEHFPLLKRVAFGPPIINVEKLWALQKAGLLDFSVARNPRVLTHESSGCFELICESIPGEIRHAEILIDARCPPVDIRRDATPLYRNLLSRRMVREFVNESPGEDTFFSGAIDMTTDFQFVINSQGMANEDIAVIGVPTEGNLVGTFSITRDDYADVWAAEVLRQLRSR